MEYPAVRVGDATELSDAIDAALASSGPALVDVLVDPT